jgi:RNA polymerase sigma-70 factor (ECF subfamily)
MAITPPSLLARLRRKDDQVAWERMVAIYEPLLRQWLYGQCLPTGDVDDLVQDVLVTVCQRMPEFEHNGRVGAFRNWLKTIVLHTTQEYWRQGRLRKADVEGSSLLADLEDPRAPLSLWWDREHDCRVVRRLLALICTDFSPGVWQIFRLLVLENQPGAAVAQQTGASLAAIYTAKSRVLARLRQEVHILIDL